MFGSFLKGVGIGFWFSYFIDVFGVVSVGFCIVYGCCMWWYGYINGKDGKSIVYGCFIYNRIE